MEPTKLIKTSTAELKVEEGSRTVVAIISTNGVDRDNEVVMPKGMRKKQYAGNPVVMVNHDYQSLPIGKTLWVKTDGDRVLAKYSVTDKTQLGRDVFALLQDGILNAHSIGFASYEASPPTQKEMNANPAWKNVRKVHREWELLEFSVVGIPANPEALALAVSKGVSNETLKLLSAPVEAEVAAATVKSLSGAEADKTEENIYEQIVKECATKSLKVDIERIFQNVLARMVG